MGLAAQASALAKRLLPDKILERMDRKLLSAGIALSAEEYAGLCLLLSILGGAILGILGILLIKTIPTPVLITGGAAGVFFGSTFGIPSYLAQRRAAELERNLPDALRQMSSTLRAGMSIDVAMEEVAKADYGALSKEFERGLAEVRRGRPLIDALWAISIRSNSPLCERAFSLVIEGIERGVALADALNAVATDIREIHAIQRERRATTMQQVLFLLAVSLFAAPFIIGLTVSIASGGEGAAIMLPEGMDTIALAYSVIQAFICALAVGIIRYGKVSKGFTFILPFTATAAIVFHLPAFLV